LKVLFFCENYRKGGLDTFIINLLNNWEGGEVSLMINRSHDGLESLKLQLNDNISVIETDFFSHHKDSPSSKSLFGKFKINALALMSYPILIYTLFKFFKGSHSFSELIVINGGYPGGISCSCATLSWKLATNKDCIYNVHNDAVEYRRITKVIQYLWDKAISICVSDFISVSKNSSDTLHVRTGLDAHKFRYIHNGINQPTVDLQKLYKNKRISLIMLSTYEERKGHEFLFSVMRCLPEYDLVVCGEGSPSETKRIEWLAEGISNIKLLGYRKDSAELIKSADLLIAPSKESESFGLTLIEAMALGTPVIATSTGGMKEVINHGVDGFLVDYGDSESLKSTIINIVGDRKLYNSIRKTAKQSFIQKYDAKIMSLNYLNILKNKGNK
jgi:glycosyltransferase involved in cell wall biosynthesis